MTAKHKVFVSYHHDNDQKDREKFEKLFDGDTFVSRSVGMGDIDENLSTETIRQRIRDDYLSDSTVTVVLIGTQTWQRKHVDWEVGSSLRDTKANPRSGLLGILLPTYPGFATNKYDPYTIPPRLYDNLCTKPEAFASIYKWSDDKETVKKWIDDAFKRRDKILPDNSRLSFGKNRTGDKWSD